MTVQRDAELAVKAGNEDRIEAIRLTKQIRRSVEIVTKELAEVEKKLLEGEFTDKGKHGPEPISDAERAKLMLAIAGTLSKLSLHEFKIQVTDMIERDIVKQRVTEMFGLVSRYIPPEKKRDFLEEFKKIWENV